MAVAHRHTEIAERQRVNAPADQVIQQENIARGLSHFRPIRQQVLAVDPVVDMDAVKSPLALGDFILVVGENVIHAAGMQVKPLPQILAGHGGTFDMPTGKALAPGTGPLHIPARLRGFPQGKIPGIAFQGVGFGPHPFQQIAAEVAGQAAVLGKLRHRKIDIAAGLVCVALGQQPPHHINHLRDVLRSPGIDVGRQDVDPGLVPMKAVGVELGDFLNGLALGQGGQNHLVAAGFDQFLAHMPHVGDVLDLIDRHAAGFQRPPNPVGHHIGAEVADMGVAIDRGAAGIHPGLARLQGADFLNLLTEGIVKGQQSSLTSRPSPRRPQRAAIAGYQFITQRAVLHPVGGTISGLLPVVFRSS